MPSPEPYSDELGNKLLRSCVKITLLHLCKQTEAYNNISSTSSKKSENLLNIVAETLQSNTVILKALLEHTWNKLINLNINEPNKILCSRLIEIPGFKESLTELANTVSRVLLIPVNLGTPIKLSLKKTYLTDDTRLEISQWIDDEYFISERRVTSEERRIRRMDSLARLLSLKSSLSVCASVTIDTKTSTLIIAANIGHNNLIQEVLDSLTAKIVLIKAFIQNLLDNNLANKSQPISYEQLSEYTADFISILTEPGGSSIQGKILIQACNKFFSSLLIEDEEETIFTQLEKKAFLDSAPVIILLPRYHNGAFILEHKLDDITQSTNIEIPIKSKTSVKFLHAEQLIAFYLKHKNKLKNNQFTIGISKLCCLTCYNCLQPYASSLIVRGHHDQFYEGVIDIFNDKITNSSSICKAPTHAACSPDDTPFRDVAKGSSHKKSTLPDNCARRLFDTTEDNKSLDGNEPTTLSNLNLPRQSLLSRKYEEFCLFSNKSHGGGSSSSSSSASVPEKKKSDCLNTNTLPEDDDAFDSLHPSPETKRNDTPSCSSSSSSSRSSGSNESICDVEGFLPQP